MRLVLPVSVLWCCLLPTPMTFSSSRQTRTSTRSSKVLKLDFSLSNPYVVVGLLFGGLLPYLFGGMAMTAVGRAGGSVVEEVRRQFQEKPGIMEGTDRPDYAAAVDMLTRAAIKEMIVPSLLPVLSPIVLFVYLLRGGGGLKARARVLGRRCDAARCDCNGPVRCDFDDIGGGCLGQRQEVLRRRFVDKDGQKHLKGSDAHMASVTGDTVGDPYKDTAGPAVNPVIKITNIVALLLLAVLAH